MFPVPELVAALFLFAFGCFSALALIADKRAQAQKTLSEKKACERT